MIQGVIVLACPCDCLHYLVHCVFTGMLDHIIVETSGVKMPLNQIAAVSVLDSKTLSINPYDPNVTSLQNPVLKSFLPFLTQVIL